MYDKFQNNYRIPSAGADWWHYGWNHRNIQVVGCEEFSPSENTSDRRKISSVE